MAALSEAEPNMQLRGLRTGLQDLDSGPTGSSLASLSPGTLPPGAGIPVQTRSVPGAAPSGPQDQRVCQTKYVGQIYLIGQTERMIFNIVMVIFLIVVIALLITVLYMLFRDRKRGTQKAKPSNYVPPFDPDVEDIDYGGSNDGKVNISNASALTSTTCGGITSTWSDTGCVCDPPFYGPTCQNESWDSRFYALGTPALGSIKYTSRLLGSRAKTWDIGAVFNPESCSAAASQDPQSVGFKYDGGMCELINPDFEVTGEITYAPLAPNTIYLKRSFRPKDVTAVFVSPIGNSALRYYVKRADSTTFTKIPFNTVVTVNFQPGEIVNYANAIGIWSKTPFGAETFDSLKFTSGVYTDSQQKSVYTALMPPQLLSDKYYVMYKHV